MRSTNPSSNLNVDRDRLEHSGLSHEKDLLQLLETLPSKPAICIKDFSTWLDPTQKGPAVWSTTLQNVKSLSFEDTLYNLPKCLEVGKNTLDHLKVLHAAFPNLESLGLYFDSRTLSDHLQHSSSTEGSSSSTAIYLPPLRKLHLYGIRGYLKPEHGTYGNIIQAIEWSTIEKLTLTNDFLVQAILPRVGLKMVCLRSLKVAIHPIDGTGRWLCEDQTLQDLRDFLAMTKVVELELYGFPKSLPISEIVSPRLRKLCLHAWEIGRRGQNGGESHLRTSHDIRQLAELAPNIEHLMIDISYMQQIWRPSANPDTVIDPDLLQVFEAIAGLSCLKILHLFPRYCRWNQHGFLDSWQQALKDDGQAVETFRFLKAKRPSLELLLLTSDNFLCTISWINPMSWRVSRLGNDTLLTTRQAGHDCEQRQIWSGTRKLRAEMKKDAFIKSYLDGVGPRRCGIRRPFV